MAAPSYERANLPDHLVSAVLFDHFVCDREQWGRKGDASAVAVLRLIARSNLVGFWTGNPNSKVLLTAAALVGIRCLNRKIINRSQLFWREHHLRSLAPQFVEFTFELSELLTQSSKSE